MNTLLKKSLTAAAMVLLVSCGGGGGSAGTSPFGASSASGVTATAANLSLVLSANSIDSASGVKVTATATATTSSGQALTGIPVSFSVDNNATFVQGATVTDANGQSVATVSIGADPSNRAITVKATSGTLTASAPFAVTGAKLTATALQAVAAPGSADNEIDFRLVNSLGASIAGQPITITAGSLGTVTGTTGVTGGYAYVYTAPTTAGTLDVTATAAGAQATQSILVQSGGSTVIPVAVGTIQSASVSANPSVVSTNDAGSTTNRTELRALFVGANNAPISNVRVTFDLNGDPNSIGGTFSNGTNTVYSDANGIATAEYIPAGRSSPTNGVTIRACFSNADFTGCPNSTMTTITVVSDPLAVSIGSNGLIVIPTANLTYIRQYVILVVDASGRAKANVNIIPSIDLDYYYKGQYVNPGAYFQGFINGAGVPVPAPAFGCPNEDGNRNGILEVFPLPKGTEDVNHSGSLEPRKSDATITILGSGQTDANGSAIVQVEYPQNVGSWLHVKILIAATGVSGTEGRATWQELLPVPESAISATASPPFVVSPYGTVITSQVVPGTNYPDGMLNTGATVGPCMNPY